ncbi:MAG: glycosyltransferase, partial [Sinobacteraceae bacterium]|nr:glycosyltransferase [Nevskiaceae bacterium]
MSVLGIASAPVLIWLYLLTGRGNFWRVALQRASPPASGAARRVVVLVPARNEAPVIGAAVTSLAQQSFNGAIHIMVIDDDSSDGTGQAAQDAARGAGALGRFALVRGAPLPRGWTGKLWALSQGVAAAAPLEPDYLLFSDADICHEPTSVGSLVASAEANDRALVSRMVRLSTVSFAE